MSVPVEKKGDRPMAVQRVSSQSRAMAEAIGGVVGASLLGHRPADRCLHDYCVRNHQLGSRDRRLISETLFSVLRWWGWLKKLAPESFTAVLDGRRDGAPTDAPYEWHPVIAASWLLENRFELPPPVMSSLREAGLFPELFRDIPDEADFLERSRYLKPFFKEGTAPAFAVEELLPPWVPSEIMPEGATRYEELLRWMQKRPPVWIRTQYSDLDYLRKQVEDESGGAVRVLAHPEMPNAFCVRHSAANLRNLSAFRAGAFEIQDLASQAVGFVCDPRPGQQWWDACAGGGGKTLQLAYMMKNRGVVEATDLRAFKLDELKLRARRGGFCNIRMKEWQGKSTPKQYRGRFDGVLVDTACSCSGTWRRTPDGRWNTTPESLNEFASLQMQLLSAASQGVKPGGTLVYSTCSMFRKENSEVVEAFLDANPEFILTPHKDPITGAETNGMTQHWPWDGDCDAMFTAKMTRRKQ